MKRGVLIAGGLLALAVLGWRAARRTAPPAPVSSDGPQAKLRDLEDVLRARNDNDPRLDSDFNDLPDDTKRLFREKYSRIPPERRNDRGTIVFLLGRNLRAPEDWAFLRAVAAEPPCLSLSDCSRSSAGGGAPGDEVTLAYPALVAVAQAQRELERAPQAPPAEALNLLRAASAAPTPIVARKAAALLKRLGR